MGRVSNDARFPRATCGFTLAWLGFAAGPGCSNPSASSAPADAAPQRGADADASAANAGAANAGTANAGTASAGTANAGTANAGTANAGNAGTASAGTANGAAPTVSTSGSGNAGALEPGAGGAAGGVVSAGAGSTGGSAGAQANAGGGAGAPDAAAGGAGAAGAEAQAGAGAAADAGVELTQEEIEALLAQPKQEFRFHHVHINAVEPAASVEFYAQHFDAQAVALGETHSAVRSGNHWLLFNQVDAPAPWEMISGIFHLGFGVGNVQQDHDRLVTDGVESETAPFSSGQRLCRGGGNPDVAFLYGPDREVFEINPANGPDFRHVHFLSTDPNASGQWYVEHTGFNSTTPNPSNDVSFCNDVQISPIYGASLDGVTVFWYPVEFAHGYYSEAWANRTAFEPQRGRAIDHVAFSVEDLDRAVARLRAEGVVLLEPAALRVDGQLRSAFIAAPDGVTVEIVEGHITP